MLCIACRDKFDAGDVIGTRVLPGCGNELLNLIADALGRPDPAEEARWPKRHYMIPLPARANLLVSAGVGPASTRPEDYVLRAHRGVVGPYLKRQFAAPVESVMVLIYTQSAWNLDPDVVREGQQIDDERFTHVLADVLAFAGPSAPVTPWRFVANLAGGNNEALALTADEIRARARSVIEYHAAWSVVAD